MVRRKAPPNTVFLRSSRRGFRRANRKSGSAAPALGSFGIVGLFGIFGFLVWAENALAQQALVLGKVAPLPNTVVEVYSPADGRIVAARERPLTVGDRVQKGDPLAVIEHRFNLHDASHMGTVRWELLSVTLEARRSCMSFSCRTLGATLLSPKRAPVSAPPVATLASSR